MNAFLAIFFEFTLVCAVWLVFAFIADRVEWAWRSLKQRRQIERRLAQGRV